MKKKIYLLLLFVLCKITESSENLFLRQSWGWWTNQESTVCFSCTNFSVSICCITYVMFIFLVFQTVFEKWCFQTYWTANDHSWKIADFYINDFRSLSFYFSVRLSVHMSVHAMYATVLITQTCQSVFRLPWWFKTFSTGGFINEIISGFCFNLLMPIEKNDNKTIALSNAIIKHQAMSLMKTGIY